MKHKASIIIIAAVLAVFIAVGAYTATTKGAVGLTYDSSGNLLTTNAVSSAGPGKLEDDAHQSGDMGIAVFGVRDDDPPAVTSGSTGDYEPLHTDEAGRLWTRSGRHSTTTATIADSASLSDEFSLGTFKHLAIALPAGWTTASMTFQCASATGGTFQNLYDDAGAEVTIASTAASLTVAVDLLKNALASCVYLKIRSGTSGSPTSQAGGDVITFVLKE